MCLSSFPTDNTIFLLDTTASVSDKPHDTENNKTATRRNTIAQINRRKRKLDHVQVNKQESFLDFVFGDYDCVMGEMMDENEQQTCYGWFVDIEMVYKNRSRKKCNNHKKVRSNPFPHHNHAGENTYHDNNSSFMSPTATSRTTTKANSPFDKELKYALAADIVDDILGL